MIDYSPLWNTMTKKHITQYYLINNGIDRKTLDAIKNKHNISTVTIEKLCRLLECGPNDIFSF